MILEGLEASLEELKAINAIEQKAVPEEGMPPSRQGGDTDHRRTTSSSSSRHLEELAPCLWWSGHDPPVHLARNRRPASTERGGAES